MFRVQCTMPLISTQLQHLWSKQTVQCLFRDLTSMIPALDTPQSSEVPNGKDLSASVRSQCLYSFITLHLFPTDIFRFITQNWNEAAIQRQKLQEIRYPRGHIDGARLLSVSNCAKYFCSAAYRYTFRLVFCVNFLITM